MQDALVQHAPEICPTLEDFAANGSKFINMLTDLNNWRSIPLLNYTPLHELKDMAVVRFRGMIQDMLDPEIYLERYEVLGNNSETRLQEGKYRDCLVLDAGERVNYDSNSNVQSERRTLFLVSIPGINSWASAYETSCNSKPASTSTLGERNNCTQKRPAMDGSDSGEQQTDIEMAIVDPVGICSSKRHCKNVESANCQSSSNGLGREYLLNSPIPDRPSKACMVKIYSDFDSYTLNSIVDVLGFLSVDPALDASTVNVEMSSDYENINELHAQNPPPSLIPRLHAIAIHLLPHANPLLDQRLHKADTSESTINMVSLQKDLRMLLTLCLFGDDLAAEYLLSHLISTVYNRSDMQSIGKFTLNICNIPNEVLSVEYTRELYGILELLLPVSHYLPMTLENMNTAQFVPKKDYETSKLVSGLLQLAPHTHLVLDETQMQQGKLEANGVGGIQNIAYLIRMQQIKCNFQFYEIDYNTDIPILILSEGKSMLPNDFILPIKADPKTVQHISETLKAAHHYLQPARLDSFRRYLTQAKISNFRMNSDDSEMIQTDFVEMRKANSVSGPQDLHALLVLSRLLAIARDKKVLDKESWELAKEMESQRKQRVQELPKPSRRVRN